MRKFCALALLIALALTGCSAIIDGEYSVSSQHKTSSEEGTSFGEMTIEAANYEELCEAVRTFVAGGVERGVVRLVSYDGDMETDVSNACIAAANEDPLGAWAVYYINHSLNRIVSYYEANITIIYRRAKSEIASIPHCTGDERVRDILLMAMINRSQSVAIYMEGLDYDEEKIVDILEDIYYDNPGLILYFPTTSIVSYPNWGGDYIVEIALSFPYTQSSMDSRMQSIADRVELIMENVTGEDVAERACELGMYLAENVRYDAALAVSDNLSRRLSEMTAYGALIRGNAVGEGYAMAMKLLCDELDIDCQVIRGRHNNVDHAWNLITLESGDVYHLDCTQLREGEVRLLNDAQMEFFGYWWENSAYPAATGESLYGEGYGAPEPVGGNGTEPPHEPEPEPEPQPEPEPEPQPEPEDPTETPELPEEPSDGPTDQEGGDETPPEEREEPPTAGEPETQE